MFRRLILNISAFYGPTGPARLVALYRQAGGPGRYLLRYWSTQQFAAIVPDKSATYRPLRWLLGVGMVAQAVGGIVLCFHGYAGDQLAGLLVGLAVILSAPLIWAHLLCLFALCWRALHIKHYAKDWLCNIFESQVKSLREQNDFTIIAVAGSVGEGCDAHAPWPVDRPDQNLYTALLQVRADGVDILDPDAQLEPAACMPVRDDARFHQDRCFFRLEEVDDQVVELHRR